MKSRFFTIVKPLLFLLVASLVCGLPATAFSTGYNSDELTNRIKNGGYLQKTDNVMVIMDGTGKQDWLGRETSQVKMGKALINNIGATIPNIPHRRMLRVFGPSADGFQKDFSTVFGLYHTDAKDYTPIIATKTHAISDNGPIELAFLSAINDLKKIDGSHAVIFISRGEQFSQSAMAESAYLKKAFGASICFYPIYLGNTPKAEAKMQQFKRIGGCGKFSTYADLDSPAEMTDFVESVFFAKKRNYKPAQPVVEAPIEDIITEEQFEPTEEVVEIIEEPYVPELIEDIEEIPVVEETSDDVIILERQLPHDKVVTIELHVEFDLNKATVKEQFTPDLLNVANFMLLYPETEVLLEGHTCTLGSDEHNMVLSKKRADAVQNTLTNHFNIPAERIKTRGAGETEPIADNATEEGRVRNRRVMAVISTIVTDYIIIEQEISKEEFLRDDFVLPPIEESLQDQIQPVMAPATEQAFEVEDDAMPEMPAEEVVVEEAPTEIIDNEEVAPMMSTETMADVSDEDAVAEEALAKKIENEVASGEEATPAGLSPMEPEVVIAPEMATEEQPTPITTDDIIITEGEAAFDDTEENPLTVTNEN